MPGAKHILVIRFSAMGDVAMTVPVIKNLLNQYHEVEITFVSNAFFAPLFADVQRCHFHPADLKNKHKGISGLWKLYRQINKENKIDAVADLHDVLRSKILRSFFFLTKKAVINKGREEKKQLTAKYHKQLLQLKTSHQRYADVFSAIDFPVQLNIDGSFLARQPLPSSFSSLTNTEKKLVGIAPFAKHLEKLYPLENMKAVVKKLHDNNTMQLIFFGGKEEAIMLEEWGREFEGSFNIAGKFSFAEELKIISNLSLMVSMDSANMHLASLYNVPVVSIWGATHPFAGFYGWAQPTENIAEANLYCRPCSVFGNKKCYRGDHACMQLITPPVITEKIYNAL